MAYIRSVWQQFTSQLIMLFSSMSWRRIILPYWNTSDRWKTAPTEPIRRRGTGAITLRFLPSGMYRRIYEEIVHIRNTSVDLPKLLVLLRFYMLLQWVW